MVNAALLLLALAVAAGLGLAALAMRSQDQGPRRLPLAGLAHGSLGLAGFAVLLLALQGPPRGLRTGTASFGLIAAVLFGLAIVLGLAIPFVYRATRRTPATLLAVHGGAAIAGFTILLAWVGLD